MWPVALACTGQWNMLDLGMQAEAKLFLSNPLVEDHVDRVWKCPARTGDFVGDVLCCAVLQHPPSPRLKHMISIVGYLGYLAVFSYSFLTMPEHVDGASEITRASAQGPELGQPPNRLPH